MRKLRSALAIAALVLMPLVSSAFHTAPASAAPVDDYRDCRAAGVSSAECLRIVLGLQ